MGLFKRVSDIISANLNDLVERFENPEKMLRQAIREMETAIADARREVARAMASEKLARKQLSEHERHAADWHAQALRALKMGDERQARKALTRKQENNKVAAALTDQLSVSTETNQTLRRQLAAMEVKLSEARRQLETFLARQRVAEVRAKLQRTFGSPRGMPGAFARFDELQEKVQRMEAEAEALGELDGEKEFGLAGTEEIDPEVEEELCELKKGLVS